MVPLQRVSASTVVEKNDTSMSAVCLGWTLSDLSDSEVDATTSKSSIQYCTIVIRLSEAFKLLELNHKCKVRSSCGGVCQKPFLSKLNATARVRKFPGAPPHCDEGLIALQCMAGRSQP